MTRRLVLLFAGVAVAAAVVAVVMIPHPSGTLVASTSPVGLSAYPVADGRAATPGPSVADASAPRGLLTAAGSAAADDAVTAFNKTFLTRWDDKAYYRLGTTGGTVTFFRQVEIMEMVEDAYQRSRADSYRRLIGALYRGLVAKHGSGHSWLGKTNDDLMWATIMSLRAYRITGDRAYRRQARLTFDAMYARAYSPDFGGGLWNSTRRLTKNTCVVAPAIIASTMLYRTVHDPAYLRKARSLYIWLRKTLYDTDTGAVYDHVSRSADGGTVRDETTWTYNQGVLIGAADQLYRITGDEQYRDDALRTLDYARSGLTVDGVLKGEVSGDVLRDCAGGFKGIFVRWTATFLRRNQVHDYDDWFRQNVAAVRSHANSAGLMNEDWPNQTGSGVLSAFSTSSAVVLLQWFPPADEPAAGPAG